jgi:hypothetical protein
MTTTTNNTNNYTFVAGYKRQGMNLRDVITKKIQNTKIFKKYLSHQQSNTINNNNNITTIDNNNNNSINSLVPVKKQSRFIMFETILPMHITSEFGIDNHDLQFHDIQATESRW